MRRVRCRHSLRRPRAPRPLPAQPPEARGLAAEPAAATSQTVVELAPDQAGESAGLAETPGVTPDAEVFSDIPA